MYVTGVPAGAMPPQVRICVPALFPFSLVFELQWFFSHAFKERGWGISSLLVLELITETGSRIWRQLHLASAGSSQLAGDVYEDLPCAMDPGLVVRKG